MHMYVSYMISMYHSAIKNETLPFVITWMDIESIMLSEIGQTKKDKYRTTALIYGIEKTEQMNKHKT